MTSNLLLLLQISSSIYIPSVTHIQTEPYLLSVSYGKTDGSMDSFGSTLSNRKQCPNLYRTEQVDQTQTGNPQKGQESGQNINPQPSQLGQHLMTTSTCLHTIPPICLPIQCRNKFLLHQRLEFQSAPPQPEMDGACNSTCTEVGWLVQDNYLMAAAHWS